MDFYSKAIKVLAPIAFLISTPSIAFSDEQAKKVTSSSQTLIIKTEANSKTETKIKQATISQQNFVHRAAAAPPDDGDNGPGSEPSSGINTFDNEDILSRLSPLDSISPDTTKIIGERIDLNTGSLSFYHTDLSLPGNSSIPVEINRVFKGAHFSRYNSLGFGDWMLDIPYIHTTLLKSNTRFSGDWGQGAECSGSLNPGEIYSNGAVYESFEFWNGDTLNVPGKINEKLLGNSGYITNKVFPKVTKSNWRISCQTENVDSFGERFIAQSPDGLTYVFSKLKLIAAKPMTKGNRTTRRYEAFMLVTKIHDRYGNYVNYNYTDEKLTSIVANDGRRIDIKYHSAFPLKIESISANGRTWTYEYANLAKSNTRLIKVTRPDNKSWKFNLEEIGKALAGSTSESDSGYDICQWPSGPLVSGSVTHPNGVKGSFILNPELHGRSNVVRRENFPKKLDYVSKCYGTMAIKMKTLSGPGISDYKWHYNYSNNKGFFTENTITNEMRLEHAPASIDEINYKSSSVRAPDGSVTKYYHNRNFNSALDGMLVLTEYYDIDGITLLRSIHRQYQQGALIGGAELQLENNKSTNYQTNLKETTITNYTLNGSSNSYITINSSWDKFGNPLKSYESNSFTNNRSYTKQAYYHDTTNWLLNLPTTTHISDNGSNYTLVAQQNYHSATSAYKSAPNYSHSFGRWTKRNESYHTSGSNKGLPRLTRLNGTNRWTEQSNYHRGVPRTIRTPRSTSTSSQYAYRVVDNNGWVTQTTDFEGNVTNYYYDKLGRLTRIDPANSYWLDTTITYTDASGGEAPGIEYGMLVKTTKRGNFEQKQYYDGLLRPILTKTRDISDSSTTSYVKQAYNAYNKVTFASQPSTSSNPSYGTYTTYDGLGRVTKVRNNALGGNGVRYKYYPDSKVAVTDNRNLTTTTTYKAYGSPSQSMPTHIATPANLANVSMQYNKFGKLTRISQGGITEYRVYDGYQNLCKTVRPDVGNTAMSIDAVGNTSWLARGNSISSSTTSCDNSVYNSDKISYSYDNLGVLKSVNYGDSTPTKTYSYDRVGNLTSLSYDGTTHTYAYNDLNLLTTESLSVDGYTWSTTNNYNSAQQISSITYPSNSTVSFNPNALGQAKQVGNYVSNVKYHANGQLKSMTQGSYCSVTQSLKTYGVPDTQRTVCRGNTALYNQYHYDGNLNVTFWDDKQSNSYDLRFTYDGLDRLDIIKNGSYTNIGDMDYDAMGNITKFKFGSNQVNYSYDSTKKLASTWGAVNYSMSYDDRGNVLSNGQKSFTYNLANQMTQGHGNNYRYDGHDRRVKAVDSKGTRYSFYNVQGKLIFERINGANRENYYLGSQLVAYKSGSTVTHIHSDLMGSTAATSNSAGTVLTRSRYKPFGSEWGSAKNEMGYTGHKFDTDLGLSYMQARYYDPVIGRFYSNDPVGFTGEVDTFNRYSYVANNPYKYTDPTGMSKEFDDRQRNRELKEYLKCEKDSNCTNLITKNVISSSGEPLMIASKVRGQKKLRVGPYNVHSDPNDVKKAMIDEKARNGVSEHFKGLRGLLKVISRGGKVLFPPLLIPQAKPVAPGYDSYGNFIGYQTWNECLAAKMCA